MTKPSRRQASPPAVSLVVATYRRCSRSLRESCGLVFLSVSCTLIQISPCPRNAAVISKNWWGIATATSDRICPGVRCSIEDQNRSGDSDRTTEFLRGYHHSRQPSDHTSRSRSLQSGLRCDPGRVDHRHHHRTGRLQAWGTRRTFPVIVRFQPPLHRIVSRATNIAAWRFSTPSLR